MDRRIVCFKVPAFEIAVARLTDASLRGRPVAVALPDTPRALLQVISPEALQDGLAVGMPVDRARRRCPSLRLLPPDPLRAQQAHRRLVDAVACITPLWEPVRPGHFFLDLTGTTRLFGRTIDTASRLEREVARRDGLAAVVGVASNKLVSRTAAKLVLPRRLYEVRPGSEEPFLAPFPVTTLPGLGQRPRPAALALLDDVNIRTLGELAEIPTASLELLLGRDAYVLSDWAHGIDPSPVVAPPQHSRLEESVTLEPDDIDADRLRRVLDTLLERLCRELRRRRQHCRRLTLTVRYSDHREVSGRRACTPGSCWEAALRQPLQALFERLARRRVRVRLLTVGVEALAAPDGQLSLFPEEPHDRRARGLALALDRIRDRFGECAIRRGRSSPQENGATRDLSFVTREDEPSSHSSRASRMTDDR